MHMHNKGLKASSLKVYLAAIKSLHVMADVATPRTNSAKIKLALKAVFELGPAPAPKLPITFTHLKLLWPYICNSRQFLLYSAVVMLGFYSRMRGVEYTYDPSIEGSKPPQMSQVTFSKSHDMFTFRMLKSKTKPLGFCVSIGCAKLPICALCSLKAYLQYQAGLAPLCKESFVFMLESGEPLSKCHLNSYIKHIITQAGWDPTHYSAHSLHSGVMTTAASAGFADWEIRKIGGWKSQTYNDYIRSDEKNH